MRIAPKIERPTRKMLEHATRGELDDLAETLRTFEDDRSFQESIGLCVMIAGYVVVDVLGPEWPDEAGMRQMAKNAAKSTIPFEIDESQIFDYIKKSAIEFMPLDRVFSELGAMATWPVVFTAGLMLTFCPRDKELPQYLDDIEEALEAADSVKPSVYPAMILAAHRRESGQGR